MDSLFSVIGEVDCREATGHCLVPSPSIAHTTETKYYWHWEKEIATPALEALGYKVLSIETGDGDSFGPLTRVFKVLKDGKSIYLMYG